MRALAACSDCSLTMQNGDYINMISTKMLREDRLSYGSRVGDEFNVYPSKYSKSLKLGLSECLVHVSQSDEVVHVRE